MTKARERETSLIFSPNGRCIGMAIGMASYRAEEDQSFTRVWKARRNGPRSASRSCKQQEGDQIGQRGLPSASGLEQQVVKRLPGEQERDHRRGETKDYRGLCVGQSDIVPDIALVEVRKVGMVTAEPICYLRC